jgi:hypothetical protein
MVAGHTERTAEPAEQARSVCPGVQRAHASTVVVLLVTERMYMLMQLLCFPCCGWLSLPQ